MYVGGIGPTYSSMAARNGITLSEMFHEETFERKLRVLAAGFKKRFGDLLEYDVEEGEISLDQFPHPPMRMWSSYGFGMF